MPFSYESKHGGIFRRKAKHELNVNNKSNCIVLLLRFKKKTTFIIFGYHSKQQKIIFPFLITISGIQNLRDKAKRWKKLTNYVNNVEFNYGSHNGCFGKIRTFCLASRIGNACNQSWEQNELLSMWCKIFSG